MFDTRVEVFWTGGFDSSFRMCQLSQKEIDIQPYYLLDDRKSESYELRAIRTIAEKLRQNPKTKARIEPLIRIPKEDRRANKEISDAFRALRKTDFMGSQYEWLGIFASGHPGIEMSIHRDDMALKLIQKHGKLKLVKDSYSDYYVLDPDGSSADLIAVFQYLRFPLAEYTKADMEKEYKAMGFADIINDTWFCFSPINGKPCGKCNPCRYTIEEGMAYRLPGEAILRYRINQSPAAKTLREGGRILRAILKGTDSSGEDRES